MKRKNSDAGWIQTASLLKYTNLDPIPTPKIAAFDFDYTIACTKGNHVYSKTKDDWKFIHPSVPSVIRKLNEDGFSIVIFSNQKGMGSKDAKNKTKMEIFQAKIESIARVLNIPLICYAALLDDLYRKPRTAMWDNFVAEYKLVDVDYKNSFYVGDAAGRPAISGRKKDHAASDLKFALNVGIDFKLPEAIFAKNNAAMNDIPAFEFDPKKLLKQDFNHKHTGFNDLEVVVFVGMPGSGKTRYYQTHFLHYTHINSDTIPQHKHKDLIIQSLKSGKSVVVDNTNPSKLARKEYKELAKLENVSASVYWFDSNYEISSHNNKYRHFVCGGNLIPEIAYRVYQSKFEEPTTDEGFKLVVKVPFVPKFENSEDEKKWSLWY